MVQPWGPYSGSLDNVAGNLDPFAVTTAPAAASIFRAPVMKAFEARFFDYFKSRLADFPDLVIGQDTHVDTAGLGS
jgi:hypothetical protein